MIRRDFLVHLAAAGASAALGLSVHEAARAGGSAPAKSLSHARDWDWLTGNWDVRHSRLKERLAGSHEWQEFGGKSAFWTVMGGLGNTDDNIVDLPGDSYRGLSIRAFDSVSGTWAIWWLDGRNPTHIDPPVRGGFDGDTGTFIGRDTLRGKPIVMRFHWRDLHGPRPWWEQAFSPDDGASWEINWRNWFTRTAAVATPMPLRADAPQDWDFLVGDWRVRHRRLRQRLAGSDAWDEFDGTLRNWPVLGGHGNVGDNLMRFPSADVRGLGIRAYDPATRQWSSWWLDGRDAGRIAPPVRGTFAGGVGTFTGDDTIDGKPVTTRVVWSRITPRTARWEQAASADGGASWETNWISDFERA
jgi:hypothetical protein